MKAGVLSWKNSNNSTMTTTYKNNKPKDTSVRKLRRYNTRNLISTYSNAELRIKPKSDDEEKMVAFIVFCFSEKILIDLHYLGGPSWLTSRRDCWLHNEWATESHGLLALINMAYRSRWVLLHVTTHGCEPKKWTEIWNRRVWPKWDGGGPFFSDGIVRERGSLSFGERLL